MIEKLASEHPNYEYLADQSFESLLHTFCEILIDIGNPRALKPIVEALKIIVEYNYELLEKLKKFGKDAIPYLQEILSYEKLHVSTKDNIIDFIEEMKNVKDA